MGTIMKNKLTQERLKEVLSYDPDTGVFVRACTVQGSKQKIGDVPGNTSIGYLRISIDNTSYRAHRLAWLYVYGEFPKSQLDHINQIKTDNRIVNLRIATHSENAQNVGLRKNNSSGYKGVSWDTRRQKWFVQIKLNRTPIFIGYYDDIIDAANAYKNASIKHHPFLTQEIT